MQLQSATDRERLAGEEAALQREASLRRIATLVAGGVTPGELFSAVAREVGLVLGVPVVTVGRYELDGGAPVSVVLASREHAGFPVGSRWPLDGAGTREIYEDRQPIRIEDFVGLDGTLARAARQQGVKWVVGAPIIVDGEVWGNIYAGTAGDEPIPEDAEARLADFIDLVSTAIANSDAREKVRWLLDEQAALRRVATLVAQAAAPEDLFAAVAREVAGLFRVRVVGLDRYENGESVVLAAFDDPVFPVGSRWPLDGRGLRTLVHETGRTARVDDLRDVPGTAPAAARPKGVRSGVAVPIVVAGQVWGVLGVGSKEAEPLPADTEQRLAAFTELVATAIANANSRDQLAASEARARELADEQAALRRVATAVAQGAAPGELFSLVAKEATGVLGIPRVAIDRYEADGTLTILGIAGETSGWIGTRWPVRGVAEMTLASGQPSRQDDEEGLPAQFGDPVRDALTEPWREAHSAVGVPIVVDGGLWGLAYAAANPGPPLPAGTEERLARFTELVATAVSNATTRSELLASRARLVSAADESRRRLERDLHDGIQQWLVALALRARKAAGSSEADESAARELSGLADDLVAVTDELREISRGIHPAILSDAGLDDALESLARRSAIRVDVEVSFGGRHDPALEATVYYVAAESITNAAKHAQASLVTLRGWRCDGAIELEIRDDGVGGADPRRGTGLIGLKDRVEALGGTISFASAAGAGTTIRVTLPAPRSG